MSQDPVLNHSVSYGKRSFSEVVLHDNNIIVAILSHFERTHEIYRDSLIESPAGGLL